MERCMSVNGTKNSVMGRENNIGLTVLSMKGFGRTIMPTAMDD